LKTPFFIGTKEVHNTLQKKNNKDINLKIYKLWQIKYSNSCPCGQPYILRFKSTTGLSKETIKKIESEISTNIGIDGIFSFIAGFTESTQENFRIFNENSIEEERHISPPECCKQDIIIYQLYSRYRVNITDYSRFTGKRKELYPIEWEVAENEYYYECDNIIDPLCGEKCKDMKNNVIAKLEFDGGKINIPAKLSEKNLVFNTGIIANKGDNIKIDNIPGIPKILNLKNQSIVQLIDYKILDNIQ
jgi:hypothetical protein